MALYFFDVHGGSDVYRDEEGLELQSPRLAEREAMIVLQDVLRTGKLTARIRDVRVHMRDDAGRVVLIASLSMTCQWLAKALPPDC